MATQAQHNAADIQKTLAEGEKARLQQRMHRNLQDFVNGNLQALKNTEFSENLPTFLPQFFQKDDRKTADLLVRMLGRGSQFADRVVRERAVKILAMFTSTALSELQPASLPVLSALLVGWLETEEEYLAGFESICAQIEKTGLWLLRNEAWEDAWYVLFTMNQISKGAIAKKNVIRKTISTSLESFATIEILQLLSDRYVTADSAEQKKVQALLLYLGERAVVYVTNRLIHSQDREERLHLAQLLSQWGKDSEKILLECLGRKPVWYVVRNVLGILASIDQQAYTDTVVPYLHHPDLRVQLAALEYILKLPEEKAKLVMLQVLPEVNEQLLPVLLHKLSTIQDDAVIDAFSAILLGYDRYSRSAFADIFPYLLTGLQKNPTQTSIDQLRNISQLQGQDNATRIVVLQAREVLRALEPRLRHIERGGGEKEDSDYQLLDPMQQQQQSAEKMKKFNEEINFLLQKKDIIRATEKIANRCIEAAREKDFAVAELLRDRLLETNPYALSEVIRVGEIIEEERSSAITRHHLEVWEGLYEVMTTEEFNALYYALRREQYRNGEIIVQTGEIDTKLYFINTGLVSLNCRTGSGEIFLKRLKPGEIHGADQFFTASVWTTTMKAQGEVEVQYLERQTLVEMEKRFPGLESKLRDFCERQEHVHSLLKMSGEDRRDFPRFTISFRVSCQFTDIFGAEGKRKFSAELLDISRSGMCVTIRIANKESAQLLLGRQLLVELVFAGNENLRCTGTIVGVKFLHAATKDFTLHLSLLQSLSARQVQQIIASQEI